MLKKLFPIYLVIFIGFVGYSMMIALFTPLFLNLNLTHKTIWLGVALFLYPFGQFLSSPIIGALSDKYGRKPILNCSLLAGIIFYALIALSLTLMNLPLLFASLFLAGIAEGNVTLAQGTIADLTPPKERGKYFGYIYLSASLAYVIGPLAAGKIAAYSSYSLPFWLVTLLLLLNLLWILFSLKESHKKESGEKIEWFEALTNMKNIFLSTRVRYYYALNFLIYLAIFGFFRSYPMYIVDEFKVGVSKLSEFIAWVAVPIVLVNLWLYGVLAKRYSARTLTLISSLFVAIFTVIIILPKNISALWITLFLTAFAIAICLPACAALLSINARSDEQGRVMGNNQSLQYFAESFSGLVAGFLAAAFIKLPLIVFGVSSLLAFLLSLRRPK